MLRFIIPAVLVAAIAWTALYGLRPKLRPLIWSSARHALFAVSIGIGVVALVLAAFSIIGGIHHG